MSILEQSLKLATEFELEWALALKEVRFEDKFLSARKRSGVFMVLEWAFAALGRPTDSLDVAPQIKANGFGEIEAIGFEVDAVLVLFVDDSDDARVVFTSVNPHWTDSAVLTFTDGVPTVEGSEHLMVLVENVVRHVGATRVRYNDEVLDLEEFTQKVNRIRLG